MTAFLKYLAYGLAGLLTLALALLLSLLLRFDPNDYKQTVIDAVQQKTGRTLTLDGDITMAFWPKLGIDLGRVSLSEQASQKPFASVAKAQVSLALLPLLEKKWLVDSVYLDGVQLTLIEHADGSTNFSDLFTNNRNQDWFYAINGLDMHNSRIRFLNEASQNKIELSQLQLKTGRIVKDQAVDLQADFRLATQHALLNKASLRARLLYNSTKSLLLADNLSLSIEGQYAQAKLAGALNAGHIRVDDHGFSAPLMTATLHLNQASHDLKTRWQVSDLQVNADTLNISNANADIIYMNGERSLTSRFNTPISAQWQTENWQIHPLSGHMTWHDTALKTAGLKADFQLSAKADLKRGTGLSRFSFTNGTSQVTGDIKLSATDKPKLHFNLAAYRWDLNTYLASPAKTDVAKPIDLSPLRKLRLDGQLKLENITYSPYQLHQLDVAIKSDGKKLRAQGVRLALDDSQIRGNVTMNLPSPHAYSVDLAIDKLNLNRYQAQSKPSQSNRQTAFEFSALKQLNASGDIRIGELRLGDNLAKQVHIALQAQPSPNSALSVRRQP